MTEKIKELTPEQEKQLQVFKERCLNIGLSTERIDRTKNRKEIDFIYRTYLKIDIPPQIVYVESPLHYLKLINLIFKEPGEEYSIDDVNRLIGTAKDTSIDELKKDENFIFHNINWSNLDIYWISFYMFPKLYMGISYNKYDEELETLFELVQNIGYVFFHEDICFISERPTSIHKKGIQLHFEYGPAVEFSDGFALWYLNGVRVTKEIVLSSADELDPKIVLTERNAEVRREIVRKIGIHTVISKLGAKSIEKSSDGMYELLNFDVIDGTYRPYLKMKNPSMGIYHVEGVDPTCTTIVQAIEWRNQLSGQPKILT